MTGLWVMHPTIIERISSETFDAVIISNTLLIMPFPEKALPGGLMREMAEKAMTYQDGRMEITWKYRGAFVIGRVGNCGKKVIICVD